MTRRSRFLAWVAALIVLGATLPILAALSDNDGKWATLAWVLLSILLAVATGLVAGGVLCLGPDSPEQRHKIPDNMEP